MGKEMCYHPKMRPTQWNQPKPDPAEMSGCECGANMHCSVCGWGRGSWPCECRPAKKRNMSDAEYPIFLK